MSNSPKKDIEDLWTKLTGGKTTFQERIIQRAIGRFQSSWSEQDTEERNRRFHHIVEMVAEYKLILTKTRHASMWCRTAIEGVINGDTDEIRHFIDMYEMNSEDPGWKEKFDPVYEKFLDLVREAILTTEAAKNRGHGEVKS